MSSSAPNILLVVMDTARADGFEPYGAPAGDTPTVAQLASAGRAYRDVFSTANWTVPSHASMLTGLQPGALGLGQVPGGPLACRPVLESLRSRLLPDVLRRSGYSTAGVSTNLWITENSGFDTGFDRFVSVKPTRNTHLDSPRLRDRFGWDLDNVQARHDDGAAEAEQALRRWLDERTSAPFFWFVNLTECHSPYLPPRPYNDLGFLGRLKAAEEARRHLTLAAIWKVCLGAGTIPPRSIERMRYLYRRSIRYMDDWLSRVFELLDTHKVLEETVIVVTSDHGENLGESNLIGHAFSLDDRLIRVPLVSSHRNLFEGAGASSLADLPAVLAGLAGLPEHPFEGAGSVDGVAVAELEGLADPSDPRAQEAAESWQLDEEGFRRLTSSAWCATDGRYKLTRSADDEVLHDLVGDPLERHPLAVESELDENAADAVIALRKAGGAIVDRRWQEREQVAPVSDGAGTAVEVPAEELEAIAEQMRRLGYL